MDTYNYSYSNINVKNNDNNKKSIFVTAILGVLIVASALYILYYDFIRADEKSLKPKEVETVLTIETKEQLLNLVPIVVGPFGKDSAYKDGYTKIEGINNAIILKYAYEKIILDNANLITSTYGNFDTFKATYCTDETVVCNIFYVENFESIIKRIYGEETAYNLVDFSIGLNDIDKCLLDGSVYMCAKSVNQPEISKKLSTIILTKEAMDGIYLYEKALFLNGITTNETNTTIAGIYKFNNYYTPLAENIEIPGNDYSDLLVKYDGEEQIFKHQFAKNSFGDYYWVSTETVSSTDK